MPLYTVQVEAFADFECVVEADNEEDARDLLGDPEFLEEAFQDANPYFDLRVKSGPTEIEDDAESP